MRPIVQMHDLAPHRVLAPTLPTRDGREAHGRMHQRLITDSASPYAEVTKAPAHPRIVLLTFVMGILIGAALCAGAILAPAPPAAVPEIVLVCVLCPLFAGWEAPRAWAALRADRAAHSALVNFRRGLARLPETQHPLDL
jgi:hypothetical protein